LESSRVELQKDRGIYTIMYINSGAFLQRTAGEFMCRKWGFLRGFSGRLTRYRNGSRYFTFAQGAKRKVALLLPCVQQAGDRGPPTASGRWWRQRPGTRGARVSGGKRRGDHGDPMGMLTLDGIHHEDGLRRRAWQQAAVQWRQQLSGDYFTTGRCPTD
jgi:hypothetical protein